MKKIYLLLIFTSFFIGNSQINWQRSEATGSLPSWFGTSNTERGMAYNPTNDHMYVVSRASGTKIKIINGTDGTDISEINRDDFSAIITGGTFFLNDVEVSDNGAILSANLTTDASASAFKIYKWDNESATPTVYATYSEQALRLGDYFKVAGDISSDAVIFAGGSGKVVRWIVNAGVLGAPTTITLADTHNPNSIVAYPQTIDANPSFFVNSAGQPIRKYNADGTSANETLSIVGGSSTDFEYFQLGGQEYISVFQYGSGEIGELSTLVQVTGGLANASTIARTPKLGANSNGNGTGGTGVKTEGTDTITVYTLSTNNGISGTTLLQDGNVVTLSNAEFITLEAKIFPNPARDQFQVSLKNGVENNAEAIIYDMNGREVKYSKLLYNLQPISIADLSNGLYFVQVKNGKSLSTTKFIKDSRIF